MIENKERGITLIALVITIVILIILASVVLVVTIDTGLIGIADESVIKNGIVEVETAYSKYVANHEKDMILSGDYSGKVNMEYLDPTTNEKYIPYCVEPAVGIERLFLMFFTESYDEEIINEKDMRIVMHFSPILAPIKAAIFPLRKDLKDKALEIFADLSKEFTVDYDEAGSIGKRYRRQDAIGTPYCITVDPQTMEDNCVTVRDRDTMEQVRMPINELKAYIKKALEF